MLKNKEELPQTGTFLVSNDKKGLKRGFSAFEACPLPEGELNIAFLVHLFMKQEKCDTQLKESTNVQVQTSFW